VTLSEQSSAECRESVSDSEIQLHPTFAAYISRHWPDFHFAPGFLAFYTQQALLWPYLFETAPNKDRHLSAELP